VTRQFLTTLLDITVSEDKVDKTALFHEDVSFLHDAVCSLAFQLSRMSGHFQTIMTSILELIGHGNAS